MKNKHFQDEQIKIENLAREEGKREAQLFKEYTEKEEHRIPTSGELEDKIRTEIENKVSRYHHKRGKGELIDYSVKWDNITSTYVNKLSLVLENAKNEEDIQKYLTQNPLFIIQHLHGGHGRYVIPKPKLGSQLIPDFLIAELSSIGLEWYGLELESPHIKTFTSTGQPSHRLIQSIQQIVDWRAWLTENIVYARNPKPKGLGLVGIDNNLPSTILMGRRNETIPERFNDFRRQMKQRQNIEIHSYDWLLEQATKRVGMLTRKPNECSKIIVEQVQ